MLDPAVPTENIEEVKNAEGKACEKKPEQPQPAKTPSSFNSGLNKFFKPMKPEEKQ